MTADFLQALTQAHPNVRAGFVERIPTAATSYDKMEALANLEEAHHSAVRDLDFQPEDLKLAEQVHGHSFAQVESTSPLWSLGVDALMTQQPGTLLGIHVADCGVLYLLDPVTQAIALLHSGKKGTELGITRHVIEEMTRRFGSQPDQLIAVLGPCIRPPHYDLDFAQDIRRQALAAGVRPENYHDCGHCTASDLSRYYSYRLEKGDTGRHLALLGFIA